MSCASVVSFAAVEVTAGVEAAWIAAAEAEGDWWARGVEAPWLDSLVEVTPGELLAGLAASRVGTVGAGVVSVAGAALPAVAMAGQVGSPVTELAGSGHGVGAAVGTAEAAGPAGAAECGGAADTTGAGSGGAIGVDPWWVDPEPGDVPSGLAGWVRPQWWSCPIRAEVRALLTLSPGVELQAHLSRLPVGVCPADHREVGDVETPNSASSAEDVGGAGVVDPLGAPVPGSVPGFPCPCQLLIVAAWQACVSWATSQAHRSIVDVAGAAPVIVQPERFARGAVTDPAGEEVAPMLALSPASTRTRIQAARELAAHPELAAIIGEGLIFTDGARAILAQTANLDEESRTTVVAAVVAKIRRRREQGRRPWTASELRQVTKAAVLALAAEAVEEARATAYARRRVSITPDGDGMAWCSALIRDVDAHRIANRLSAQAAAGAAGRRDNDDDRTAEQVQTDILVELLLGRLPADLTTHPDTPADVNPSPSCDPSPSDPRPRDPDSAGSTGPVPRAQRAEISVVCTLTTLLGLTCDPAEVPGLGPVPAGIARELAADGRWRLLITNPSTGQVIATGSRTYAPSAALARLIRSREPSCRMPGCNRQAVNCDVDHTVSWPQEPGTTASNLGPLCRRHHNLKTHHGFHLVSNRGSDAVVDDAPASWTWTFPSGITHTDHPDPPLDHW